MNVLIVNNMAPFVWGGAEELAVNLRDQIKAAGHKSEVLRVPFQWEPAHGIPSQMVMARWLEFENVDRIIALKFPAYLAQHEHKTLWLLHQYRQAYDLFETGHTNLPPGKEGEDLRRMIRTADDESFDECRAIFVNYPVTQDRLLSHNGRASKVLYPPVNDPELFNGGPIGDYVFAGGRINSMKRQHLIVEGLVHADPCVKLVVAGPPDTPEDATRLCETVERLELSDRVRLDLRMLPREVYADYVNKSAAVAYIPFDEDSLGYVAMEAATAARPIITTTDAGGVLGLVRDNQTGWVSAPEAASIAGALSAACTNTARAAEFGRSARELWDSFGITWPRTVEVLLA